MNRKHARHDSKIETLRAVPGLRGLDDRSLAQLAQLADEIEVQAGTVLTRQGESGHEAFVIGDGSAEVHVGGELVGEVGPGDIIGELALVEHRPRTATITARTRMRLLVIGPSQFDTFASSPPVARGLLKTVAGRLRAADERLGAS